MMRSPDKRIAAILRHDTKQNTYKIALIRAILVLFYLKDYYTDKLLDASQRKYVNTVHPTLLNAVVGLR